MYRNCPNSPIVFALVKILEITEETKKNFLSPSHICSIILNAKCRYQNQYEKKIGTALSYLISFSGGKGGKYCSLSCLLISLFC